jgi:hypothetical protein
MEIKAANIVAMSVYMQSFVILVATSAVKDPCYHVARVPQHITRRPLTPVTSHHTLSPPPCRDKDRDRGRPSKMGRRPHFKGRQKEAFEENTKIHITLHEYKTFSLVASCG